MCGIAGLIDFSCKSSLSSLTKMTDILKHRGPDNGSYKLLNEQHCQIGLGHRRLSIIDLHSRSNQPMVDISNNYWIVFNGEIYNFNEIKTDLLNLGYIFNSNSDTEVILKAYMHWGIKAVHKFIGMFTFVIYDKVNQKVFMLRDRAGVKPLFIYEKDDLILFSSEIKSFHSDKRFSNEIDTDSLSMFFRNGYIHSPYSIYKHVKKLIPGHYFEIDLVNKSRVLNKYWDVIDAYNEPKLNISYSEAKSELKKQLSKAFNYRMVSDVPVGVFLSSGYDSSTTAAILASTNSNKINTYTIGFNNSEYDESKYAKKIADHIGTNHTTLHIDENHIEEIVESLPFYYDEPFGDSSAIPSILVSKLAKDHVKVVLSSDGGDELYAGYHKHFQHHSLYRAVNSTPNFIRNRLSFLENYERFRHRKGLFSSKNESDLLKTRLETMVFNEDEIDKLLIKDYSFKHTPFDDFDKLNNSNDFINKLLAIDYKTYLENDILVKMDRATMSQSIEGREPFLDHNLLEFSARLDSSFKYKNKISKYILRDINSDFIPKELMHGKKMGFGGPVDNWLKTNLNKELMHLIEFNEFPDHLLNKNFIKVFVNDFNIGKHNKWYRVYQIYNFLKWYKYWN